MENNSLRSRKAASNSMTTKAAEGASSYRSEKWMMKRGSAAQEQYSFYGKQHITRPRTNGLMALGTAGNKITLVYFSPLYCVQYNRTIQTDTFLCFPCSYIPSSLMRLHHLFSHWSSAFCAVRNDKKNTQNRLEMGVEVVHLPPIG